MGDGLRSAYKDLLQSPAGKSQVTDNFERTEVEFLVKANVLLSRANNGGVVNEEQEKAIKDQQKEFNTLSKNIASQEKDIAKQTKELGRIMPKGKQNPTEKKSE